MRYEPYDYEYAAIPDMTNAQLLEYFLTRTFETEEIWGLKEGGAFWMTYDRNGEETLPLFPYKLFADEAAVGDWEVMIPVAESLEFFMEKTLNRLIQENIVLEIMPRKDKQGIIVSPQQIYNILDNMIDHGTYTMEG